MENSRPLPVTAEAYKEWVKNLQIAKQQHPNEQALLDQLSKTVEDLYSISSSEDSTTKDSQQEMAKQLKKLEGIIAQIEKTGLNGEYSAQKVANAIFDMGIDVSLSDKLFAIMEMEAEIGPETEPGVLSETSETEALLGTAAKVVEESKKVWEATEPWMQQLRKDIKRQVANSYEQQLLLELYSKILHYLHRKNDYYTAADLEALQQIVSKIEERSSRFKDPLLLEKYSLPKIKEIMSDMGMVTQEEMQKEQEELQEELDELENPSPSLSDEEVSKQLEALEREAGLEAGPSSTLSDEEQLEALDREVEEGVEEGPSIFQQLKEDIVAFGTTRPEQQAPEQRRQTPLSNFRQKQFAKQWFDMLAKDIKVLEKDIKTMKERGETVSPEKTDTIRLLTKLRNGAGELADLYSISPINEDAIATTKKELRDAIVEIKSKSDIPMFNNISGKYSPKKILLAVATMGVSLVFGVGVKGYKVHNPDEKHTESKESSKVTERFAKSLKL